MNSRKRHQEETNLTEKKKRTNQDADAQKLRSHHGLINQGATCYLNSVLQVLYMTPEIHDKLNPDSQITDEGLRILFQKLKKSSCETKSITKTLEIQDVCQQRDAAECLDMILQKISPQASKVFQGELTNTTKCSKGHIIIEETNPFWTLPLSLKNNHDTVYSVQRGFERIFHPKRHSGNNKVYCNECKDKREGTSGCEMVTFPLILTLLLKRFDFDYNTMSDVKLNCNVDVPRVLETKNYKYKLYGIVDHMGSLRGGHYTATVLNVKDNTWYQCDDSHIMKVKPFAEDGTHSSTTAYLLMYRASLSQREEVKDKQDGKDAPAEVNKTSANMKKSPLCIFLIVFGCLAVVILLIIVTAVNTY